MPNIDCRSGKTKSCSHFADIYPVACYSESESTFSDGLDGDELNTHPPTLWKPFFISTLRATASKSIS